MSTGDKKHNYLTNLEWTTGNENIRRAIKNDQYPGFEMTLDESDVHIICQMLKDGMNYMEISNYFLPKYNKPINRLVARIYRGEAWKDISKQYMPFPKINPSYFTLTPELVEEICSLLEKQKLPIEIANYLIEKYNLNTQLDKLIKLISNIKSRRNWRNVSEKYNF